MLNDTRQGRRLMELESEYELPYPAAQVWALLSDFRSMPGHWPDLDRVESDGEGVGMTRTLYWKNSQIPRVQRLDALDTDAMSMRFSPLNPVVPVTDFHIFNCVEAITENSCKVCSVISFQADEAGSEGQIAELLEQVSVQIGESVRAYLGGKA